SVHAALILFLLVVPVFLFFATPGAAAWSRRHEFAADRFAAEHASGSDLAAALVKLYRDNATTLTPDRLSCAFYDSHPPALERIERLRALGPGGSATG
ncbi:MAG: M48 family metalloprotease, partial [Steroidobacteraceae bacterium]